VAVKIKLMRMGKIRAPYYRIIVADARNKRDGRAIEEIGKYHPTQEPSLIEVDSERAQYWLGVGAQPTEPVAAILKITGDWQKFKGLPGAEGTLRTAETKADKKTIFEAAAKDAASEPKAGATTPKKKAPAKKAAATAETAPSREEPSAGKAAAAGDATAAADTTETTEAPATAPAEDAPAAVEATVTEEPATAPADGAPAAAEASAATEGTDAASDESPAASKEDGA
jgi:small subunit ribosomal protein S16